MNKIIILGEKKEAVKVEINTDSEIIRKDEIESQMTDWWVDSVIDSMPYDWWRIRMQDNKIIIEPVTIEPMEG